MPGAFAFHTCFSFRGCFSAACRGCLYRTGRTPPHRTRHTHSTHTLRLLPRAQTPLHCRRATTEVVLHYALPPPQVLPARAHACTRGRTPFAAHRAMPRYLCLHTTHTCATRLRLRVLAPAAHLPAHHAATCAAHHTPARGSTAHCPHCLPPADYTCADCIRLLPFVRRHLCLRGHYCVAAALPPAGWNIVRFAACSLPGYPTIPVTLHTGMYPLTAWCILHTYYTCGFPHCVPCLDYLLLPLHTPLHYMLVSACH